MKNITLFWLLFLLVGLSGFISDAPGEQLNCPGTIKGIKFVPVPGDAFRMGSEGYGADEVPVHEVRIDPFCMSATEITVRQMMAVMGRLPRGLSWNPPPKTRQDSLRQARRDSLRAARTDMSVQRRRGDLTDPDAAVSVSWNGAVEFCNEFSRLAGLEPCYDTGTWECDFSRNGFRLPSEAEWEYACRAGTSTVYSTGDDPESLKNAAWFGQKKEDPSTRIVGLKEPNAFGLYDMHGNVWEWCNDWYRPDYYADSPCHGPVGPPDSGPGKLKANRGGSRSSGPLACRSATRRGNPPAARNSSIGFRVVCRPH